MSPIKPSFCTTKRRNSKTLKINTSKTKMPPKKDEKKESEDEDQELDVHISFKDLEKSMTTFTGDDTYPIDSFIDEFEDTAQIMKWTKIEKLIYAKRLLDGTAKLFLRSLGRVKDYTTLKKALKEEFGPKINSAIVHKKLASRKMKNDETYQQYFLTMKELALHGKVEDAALIEYVIDGIRDSEPNKAILYGASDIKDFRKKFDIYSEFRKKISSKPTHPSQSSGHHPSRKITHVKRCFNCGDQDHQAPTCPKGVKCFKCNEFGHKSTDCPNNKPKKTLNIEVTNQNRKEVEKSPYKKIEIGNKHIIALIDTGSDVNIITKTEFEKIKEEVNSLNTEITTSLTGIAEKKVYTEGVFTVNAKIDNYYTDMKFHIVKDNEIPVNVIIGNPILKDFEVSFTPEGVYVEKINQLTLLVEEEDTKRKYDIEESKNTENIYKMCEDYKPEKKKESRKTKNILEENDDNFDEVPREKMEEEPNKEIVEEAENILESDGDEIKSESKNDEMKSQEDIDQILEETKKVLEETDNDFDNNPKENAPDKNNRGEAKQILESDDDQFDPEVNEDVKTDKLENTPKIEDVLQETKDKLVELDRANDNANLSNDEISIKVSDDEGNQDQNQEEDEDTEDKELKEMIEWESIQLNNERREELRRKAKESIRKIQEENVKNYNKKRKDATPYEVGELVAIKKTQFSTGSKLYPKYLGPYEVTQKKRNDRYAVRKVGDTEGPYNTTTSAPWVSPEDASSSGADE